MKNLITEIASTFAAAVLITCLFYPVGKYTIGYLNANNGIYNKPDTTEVIYLLGEACTVNMTKDSNISEINSNMVWCMEQHLNYIAEEK